MVQCLPISSHGMPTASPHRQTVSQSHAIADICETLGISHTILYRSIQIKQPKESES
jgi:hypothetical protein